MKKLQPYILVALVAVLAGCGGDNIKFADKQVKTICLGQWDTDGNGKLSYEEAAAVTQISKQFCSTNIGSFDEFKYFTGVELIYRESFANCLNLKSISLPESVREIGREAFGGCGQLESIDLPDGLTYISASAFEGCDKLPIIGGIRYADNYAIELAGEHQQSYTLKEGTRMVADVVLAGIANSTGSITIPEFVNEVADKLFMNGFHIESVKMPGVVNSIGKFAFQQCTKLTEVTLSESLASIGDYAFRECSSLASIVIPAGVKSIGSWAFFDCTGIEQVYCHATAPPTVGYAAFKRSDNNPNAVGAQMPLPLDCKIYVPAQSVEAYKSAAGWSDYATNIVGYSAQ